MRKYRFSTDDILQMMRKVDMDPRVPVGHIFILALAHLFRGRGIGFDMVMGLTSPDIKLRGPSTWERCKATKDLIVHQGIDIKV